MKRATISFLMVFVLMLPWGTQVFAQDDSITVIVNSEEKYSYKYIYGQHGYGVLEAKIAERGTKQTTVTLFEVLPDLNHTFKPIYEIYANPNNRYIKVHYYLEGGHQYAIRVSSQGYGEGKLTNYIP